MSEPPELVCASSDDEPSEAVTAPASGQTRKRPRPGERRVQILQTLAGMLEQPHSDRITTAALAAQLKVSEAALYRHFASKAQMFEGLIEFIESSVFSLINQVMQKDEPGGVQAQRVVALLLQFAQKNPGMTRLMVGDALVLEHDRLNTRMNLLFDKVEAQLRQALRPACELAGSAAPTVDAAAMASALMALTQGRLQRFSRSGFQRSPLEHLDHILPRLTP